MIANVRNFYVSKSQFSQDLTRQNDFIFFVLVDGIKVDSFIMKLNCKSFEKGNQKTKENELEQLHHKITRNHTDGATNCPKFWP